MALVLALDAGTTGVRSLAFDDSGRPVASSYREFPQYFPRPGWVEHDPVEIWEAQAATIADLLGKIDQPVSAIGITNQRETVVVWDRRTGRPLAPAIVWQDRRTAGECERLQRDGHLPTVRQKTGLVLDPYFSATKLGWLFHSGAVEAGPDVAFGTVDTWLVWCLTGGKVHATDHSNASRTLLFDIDRLAWDADLCELFGVPVRCLPDLVPSSGRMGVTADGVVAGLAAGVPISGCAGDQQSALFGQACFEAGMTKNTYGTGSFVLMNVGPGRPPPVEGLLTTVAWTLGASAAPAYALEGAIFVTGAAVQWLRDQLGLIGESAEIGPLAASVPDSGGAYLVPAFTGLGSPWWDPEARGTLVGLTRGVGKAQLAKAALEAMAFQTQDVVDSMVAAGSTRITELRVDGGASVVDLLLQLQADLTAVPVVRAAVQDTTALGAALLAGLAEGVWSSLDEITRNWKSDRTFTPAPDTAQSQLAYEGWLRAVERARRWDVRG